MGRFRVLGAVILASSTLSVATGCGGESLAHVASGGAGGAPIAHAGAGGGGAAGAGPGGSSGVPGAGGFSGGTTLVSSDRDPGCIDFPRPPALDILVGGEGPALTCDGSRSDLDSCAGEGELVAFEYETEELAFWINFRPALVAGPITEAALRENFRWFWYQVKIPANAGGEPFSTDRIYVENVSDADLFNYADGRLHVKAHTTVEEMVRWIDPEGPCYDTDEGTRTCACRYAVGIPTTVDLDVAFPE